MSNPNRPASLILSPASYNELPGHKSLNDGRKRELGRSSSSSIDSTEIKNSPIINRSSLAQTPLTSMTPTTTTSTTDSEISSDRDDQAITEEQDIRDSARDTPSRTEKNFLKLFKGSFSSTTPKLIQSYVCAYQGDILLQGKMYITDNYLCFHSKIIAYVTRHVYHWNEIQNVTKERVAFIFPTAIGIQLKKNPRKLIYASFITRDQAFNKIVLHWTRATRGSSCVNFQTIDDNQDEFDNEGTLKANNVNSTSRRGKSPAYEITNGSEGVLEMCLEETRDDRKLFDSMSSKISSEKSSVRSERNQSKKRSSSRAPETQIKSMGSNSSKTKRAGQKENNPTSSTNEREGSIVTFRPNPRSPLSRVTTVENQSGVTNTTSVDPSSSPTPPINQTRTTVAEINSVTAVRNPHFKAVSCWRKICGYFLSFYQQLRSYPMKTTVILLLFLILLVFHAFYLIQVAYRIEDRLRSLYQYSSHETMKSTISTISMKKTA